jgi:hypothetical protein
MGALLGELAAVAGLGALCGAWVLVQRWVVRHDPDAPGVEGSVGCAASCRREPGCAGDGCRDRDPAAEGQILPYRR